MMRAVSLGFRRKLRTAQFSDALLMLMLTGLRPGEMDSLPGPDGGRNHDQLARQCRRVGAGDAVAGAQKRNSDRLSATRNWRAGHLDGARRHGNGHRLRPPWRTSATATAPAIAERYPFVSAVVFSHDS